MRWRNYERDFERLELVADGASCGIDASNCSYALWHPIGWKVRCLDGRGNIWDTRVTFEQLLDAKGIKHFPGSKAGEVNVCCPFCNETRFRLGVNVISGKAKCFNCDWGSKLNSISKVLAELRIKGESDEQPKQVVEEDYVEINLPEEYERVLPIPRGGDFHRTVQEYLHGRGMNDEQIRKKRVGLCLTGRYAFRIVFPVVTQGELCGFVTRDFTQRQDKPYLNSVGKKALYNLHRKKKDTALLVEGILKCLAAERVLGDEIDCLAVLGKSITDEQIELLKGYKHIIILPDNDGPGLRGALRMAGKLMEAGFKVSISRLSKKFKDCDEAYMSGNIKTIRLVPNNARPMSDLLVSKIRMEAAWEYRAR